VRSKQNRNAVLCAALVAALSCPAFADYDDDHDGRTGLGFGPYIGIEGGANFGHDEHVRQNGAIVGDMRYQTGFVGGLTFGLWTDLGLRPEIELDYRRNTLRNFEPAPAFVGVPTRGYEDVYTAMGNLWWEFNQPSGPFHVFHPYLGAGAGGARLAFHDLAIDGVPFHRDFDTVFAWQAGGGLGFNVTRDVVLSFDYRYLQSNIAEFETSPTIGAAPFEQRYRAHTVMLGLQARFGIPPPAPVVVERTVEVPVAPPPPPPAPDRCSFDSDHDGVGDCEDRCPGTAAGFKVDATGCVVEQTVVLHTINFEFDSDRLTVPSQTVLNEIVGTLRGQSGLYVEIGGHTDSIGSDAYNDNLSQRRANSVMRYLVAQGVDASHLSARGYGERRPIASNNTEDGRAENRRVEFKVLQQPADVKVVPMGSTPASKEAAKTEPENVKRKHGR